MVSKRLPLLELKGSSYEIGRQHGEQAVEQIKAFSQTLLKQAQAKNPGVTKDKALLFAKRLIPFIKEAAPHLVDEMDGIADGAGVPREEIYFLNARNEMYYRKFPGGECTTFGLSGSRTADGEVMIGQNADTSPGAEKSLVMMHITPNKGPQILQYARAGTIAHIGINSYGLARVGNGLKSSDFRELGVPKVLVDRLGIEQKSIDDVLKVVKDTTRTMSNNYIYADSTGKILDIEVTAYEHRTIEPTDGSLAHANNYEHPDLLKYDLDRGYSEHRSKRMKELIANEKRPVTEDMAKEWLRDHAAPLCRHVPPQPSKTVASIISRPSKRLMYVCWGNPCEGEYYTYKL